jgi:hypothetical protein
LTWFDFAGHLGQSITADGKDRKRVSREPREPREKVYFKKPAKPKFGHGSSEFGFWIAGRTSGHVSV